MLQSISLLFQLADLRNISCCVMMVKCTLGCNDKLCMQVVVVSVLLRMVRQQTILKGTTREWKKLLQIGRRSGSKSTVLLSGRAVVWPDTRQSRSLPDLAPCKQ